LTACTRLPPSLSGIEEMHAADVRWQLANGPVTGHGVDKFPRMVDYVLPTGVRVADADRVRLGAHLAAGTTVIALAAATWLAFGPDLWWSFAASTETSRKLLLERGDVGFEKLQSVFAAVRMWGGGVTLGYIVQGAASVAGLLVTTEAMVAEVPQKKSPPMPGGGGGGMGGMDF